MSVMLNTGGDVVTFLKMQHEDIMGLLDRVETSHGEERAKAFLALRRTIAVHETAEEEIVHPAARRVIRRGESLVDALLGEEKGLKIALTELEMLDVDGAQFDNQLILLRVLLIAHTTAEERSELRGLSMHFDSERLDRMRRAVALSEAVAPTRPHAAIHTVMANLLVGTFASMLDRSRDALASKP